MEGRSPPLGPLGESGDLPGRQRCSRGLLEVRGRLVDGEAQLTGTHLEQLPSDAQAPQRQRRIDAAGDHDTDPRGQSLQQHRHALVDRDSRDHVVVVEDQDQVGVDAQELVEQGRDHDVDRSL